MSTPELVIRPFEEKDRTELWPILHDVIRPGDTYAIDPEISREELLQYWCDAPKACFVAETGGQLLGTYYIKSNQPGGGAHVCNCGYITAPAARGRGTAEALCRHSQDVARDLGYLAMQFNFVLASNTGAIRLWTRLGYETVGRLPKVFWHPKQGFVDALVMYKSLEKDPPQSVADEGVLSLERALLDPQKRADANFLAEILHADFVEIGQSGQVYDKAAIMSALAKQPEFNGPRTLQAPELTHIQHDVALLRYQIAETGTRRSSVWRRSAGRWQLLFHQGTRVETS